MSLAQGVFAARGSAFLLLFCDSSSAVIGCVAGAVLCCESSMVWCIVWLVCQVVRCVGVCRVVARRRRECVVV